MGYNARNDEIRDNVTRMRREWEAQRKAEHKQFNLDPKDISELYDVMFVGFPDPHRGQVGALRPILRTSCRNTCWSFGRWKIAALTNGIFDDGKMVIVADQAGT